jgi:hypothetical protein
VWKAELRGCKFALTILQSGLMSRRRPTPHLSVCVTTLDELLSPEDLRSKILLRIDTQGYERHVLDGATNMLRHVRGVLVELSIIILYQDNWRLHEAVAYMYERGFVLAQVHPVNIHFKKPYAATEFDCLFRPTESGVD